MGLTTSRRLRRLISLWAAAVLAVPCLLAGPQAGGQGFAGMGTDAEGYSTVERGRTITFPRDHGAHPGFRIEWWYLTANLRDAGGEPLGIQWTLFRFALAPPPQGEGWATQQMWMGHAAVTTASEHRHAEVFARGGVGTAGAEAAPFRAWIDDWRFESTGADFSPLRLTARGPDFAYDLRLVAEGPMVLQGEGGYSVKSATGQASHYVSQPFFRIEGTVSEAGATRTVTGRGWMDREWSSQPLAENQTGWDWLSLHLPGGDKLMAFRLRQDDGAHYLTGNWISADGHSEVLAPGSVEMTPLAETEIEGRDMPTEWRVRIPARGLDIVTRPLNPRAWNANATAYWEGPVTFTGSAEGEGYLELTGY